MSITKCRDFCKRMIQKLSFSFPQKASRIYRFLNSVIPKQFLEPKLVISVRLSHSSMAPRLLGFHKVPKSVSPISNTRSDRVSLCNGISQIGGTEFFNSVGPRWFRRKPNPKIFESNLIYEFIDWIEVYQTWQESQCARNRIGE